MMQKQMFLAFIILPIGCLQGILEPECNAYDEASASSHAANDLCHEVILLGDGFESLRSIANLSHPADIYLSTPELKSLADSPANAEIVRVIEISSQLRRVSLESARGLYVSSTARVDDVNHILGSGSAEEEVTILADVERINLNCESRCELSLMLAGQVGDINSVVGESVEAIDLRIERSLFDSLGGLQRIVPVAKLRSVAFGFVDEGRQALLVEDYRDWLISQGFTGEITVE